MCKAWMCLIIREILTGRYYKETKLILPISKRQREVGHIDEKFEVNWQEASKTNVKIGAYHFFSFDSPGKEQAEWFIDSVGNLSGKLPPVVDIEYYGNKEANPPDEETVIENLQE